MAYSWQESSATAGQTTVAVNIAYLDKSDIYVEINDVEVTGFTWDSDTLITLPTTIAVAAGDKIAVIRRTDRSTLRLLFSEGAAFTRENLDEQNDQFLYLAQELVEGRSIGGFYGDLSMNGYRIADLGSPQSGTDAANKNYVDSVSAEVAAEAEARLETAIGNTVRVGTPIKALSAPRANMILGFDANGDPTTFTAASGSAQELAKELASSNGASDVGTTSGETVQSSLDSKVATKDLTSETGFSLVGMVPSFDALRSVVPSYSGQRVYLAAWNENIKPYGQSSFGGDEFVAVAGSYTDDNGFIARVSDSWAWQRCRNVSEANVLHFGGVPGGTFDNHTAIMSMHIWSQNLGGAAAPGIVFPAGEFYTTPLDFTSTSVGVNNHTFNLHGPEVTHGKHCQLTILSDKSTSPVFKIEAYDGDVAFFNFDGQATISGTTPSNTQPFLENVQSGPQNVHIRYWYIKNVGGLGFKLSDTLDTRFDETYCDGVYGGLYDIGYDNQASGNWDHPTAVEWSNFNYQNVYPEPVFKAPRLRQALIKNGWIEKSNPGDLTDSQIAMITFCIEDCYTDASGNVSYLDLRNSNFTLITSDIQPQYMKTGYNVDTAWNTSYLPGQSLLEPHGIFTSHGTIASRMAAGPMLINTYDNSGEVWYYIGRFWFQDIGSSVQLEVTGDAGAVWDTTAVYPWSTQHGGYSLINIQRKSDGSAQHINWSNHGGPVTDLRFTGGGGNQIEVWVKVGASARCSLRAKVSTPGDVVAQYNNTNLSSTLWFGDVTQQDPPSDARTPMTSWINRAGWQQDSSGNVRRGGLGIASDGRLIAGAATLDLMSGETSSGVTRNLVIYVDGVPYSITATQITQ